MKKIIYICDRCKNEVAEPIAEVCSYELCDKCAAKAAELVAKFVKLGVPEREERPKKWDVGKAQALRDAGWTIERIAEEIGVSAPTIIHNTTPAKPRKARPHEWAESEPVLDSHARLMESDKLEEDKQYEEDA